MGNKNNVMCSFLENAERFADFINGSLYGGSSVIHPEQISECQTVYSQNGESRDLLKLVCEGGSYTLIGVENQAQVHYAMPIRCMEYDLQEYKKQLRNLKTKYRRKEKEDRYKLTSAEFISGLKRNDKLYPVTTVVFYHGMEPYDGCVNLHDMLDFKEKNEIFKQYVSDYQINLVTLRALDEDNFQTELRDLIGLLKRSHDKKEFLKFCHENKQRMSEIGEETFDAISVLTDREDLIEKKRAYVGKGGRINMCKAMEDWAEELKQEGINQGLGHGIEAFVLDHLEDGMEEKRIIEKLQKRFRLDAEAALETVRRCSLQNSV